MNIYLLFINIKEFSFLYMLKSGEKLRTSTVM